jgi:hypothetical protein
LIGPITAATFFSLVAAALQFAALEPLPHPLAEAVIPAASFSYPEPTQAHFAANAAGLQAENAAEIHNGIHAVCVNDMRYFSREERRREHGHSLIRSLGPHLRDVA